MLLLAATTLEKLKAVPPMFWVKVAGVIAVILIGAIVLQKVAHMNKMVLGAIAFVVCGVLGFTWVYERNEPKFMSWLIDPIASSGFFPTKEGYEIKQAEEPGTSTKKKAPPAK